ncbi:hypothetical protein ACTFIW_005939 [Dictyostelium discoideum]
MSLTLKIQIVRDKQVKAMKFSPTQTVAEVCAQVREKINETSGDDHGLFQPGIDAKRPSRWLKMDKTLQFYDLKINDELDYKKKHRPLKVRLMDETVKTMLVDDSLTAGEILEIIGKRIGIKNYEEFSLQTEGAAAGEWINHAQPLHEQGVPDDAVVLLKKKFFVDDFNVNRDDPIQLHLVYVQSRDAIISGSHPCSYEEAVQFGALQCQIQLGNHNPNLHKPGYLKIKEYFPPSFHKKKDAEKDIYKEFRKLTGMSESNSKFRYVQLCRSLKTYGITFFLTKERVKGQKKPVPKLLGITRDSILRLDAETKEVEHEYPLNHLRRWAASPQSFTLDFGDYEDDYVSVITTEGEAISQLLSGYIEILMKKRKDTGTVIDENETDIANVESVGRIRGQTSQATTSSSLSGYDGNGGREGQYSAPGQAIGYRGGLGGPLSIKVTNIDSASAAVANLLNEMELDPNAVIGQKSSLTPQQWRQQLAIHAKAVAAAAGKLLGNLNNPNGMDKNQMDSNARDVALTIDQLVHAARAASIASGEDPDGEMPLFDGAKAVAESISKLLKATKDLSSNPNDENARNLIAQAADQLKLMTSYLDGACNGVITDSGTLRLLMEAGKAIAIATQDLVNQANVAIQDINDPIRKNQLNMAIDETMKAGIHASAVSQALAATILDPNCRQQFNTAAKTAQDTNNYLLSAAKAAQMDPALLEKLRASAKSIAEAYASLIQSADLAQPKSGDDVEFTSASKTILSAAAQLLGSHGKSDNIMQQAKVIEEAMGHLIAGARRAALKTDDPGVRDRLIQCSKAVAEAVRNLMEIAQDSADNPEDKVLFAKLQESSKRVANAVKQLVGDAGKESAFQLLRTNAKLACAATTGLMNTSRQSMLQGHLSDQESNKLLLACVQAGPAITNLLNSITSSQKAPNDLPAQNQLIEVARVSAPIAYQVVAIAKGAIPHFTDQHSKQEVSNSSNTASDAIRALLDAIGDLTSAVGQQEFDDALDTVQALEADMESSTMLVQAGTTHQIPGQTRENALELLNVAARALGSSAKQVLLQYKTSPEKLGETSKDLATSVSQVTNAAKSVCFTTQNRSVQKAVLGAAKQITTESTNLVSCARAVSSNPGDPSLESALQSSVKAIAEALANLLTTSKGGDPGGKDLDDAIEAIKNDTKRINNPPVNLGGEGGVNSEKAISSSKALVGAVSQVAANARSNPSALGASARTTSTTFTLLVDTINLCTGTIVNKQLAIEIVKGGQLLGIETIKLLQASRFAASRPGEGEGELNQSQQSVSNTVKQLIYNIQSSVPGQAEIADALEIVKQAIIALNSSETSGSRPNALESLTQAAKNLADYTAQVVQSKGNSEKMGTQCKSASESLKDVVEYTKASLSTAEGHPDSIKTLASKVDDSSNALFNSCKKTGQLSDQDKKNAALDAKNLALSVPNLMGAAKKISASLVQSNPEKSKDILLVAQNITIATSKLVNIAKSVASGQSQADVSQLAATKKEVSELISKLLNATNGHDQDATTISIDLDSLSKSEQALLDASRSTANYMSQFMAIGKTISTGTKDPNVHQQFSGAAQNVSSGVQQLLSAINGMKPEQKDLDESIEIIQNAVVDLDSATLNAAIGLLENTAPVGKTAQVCQEELVDISRELATSMKTFLAAPKQDPNNLGQSAKDTANILPKIVNISKQLASLTTNPDIKQTQLLLSKKLADNMLELMISAKSGDVSDSKQAFNASQSIADILTSVKGGVMQSRDCDESIQIIGKSKENLQKPANDTHGKTYQQYRDEMTEIAKQLALGVSQLANSAKSKPEEIGSSSLKIASIIPRLAETARSTAAATNDVAAKKKLIDSTAGIIDATSNIISDAKLASADHKNTQLQQKISNNFKDITTQIANLIAALRAGATADRDIENACNEVNHVTTDLDAASLFAAAGQIDIDTDGHTAQNIQEQVGKLAQDLKDSKNQLAEASGKTIEDVGTSAKATASINQKLAHATKVCAALTSDSTTQQNLLSAARTVSSNLQQTISASKNAQKNPTAGNKAILDKSSQELEESIDSLANLVQSSTTTKGISELEGVSSEIRKQLAAYDSGTANVNANATAEDVVNSAKNLAESIAYLVSSCNNSPEDIAEASKGTTLAIKSLLANAKGASVLTDDAVIQQNVTESAKAAAQTVLKLIQAAKQQRNDPSNPAHQNKLSEISSEVVESISTCVNAAEDLPEGKRAKLLFAAGESLEETAEKELKAAAAIIEEATAALLNAKKKREQNRIASGIDEAGIDESILEAARAITSATGVLVQCATNVQHELVLAGKVGNKGNMYRRDPTWARGLISAAQAVAGSVQGLVHSANSSSQGKVDEEQLVASAKGVAAATARLVTASRAKADLNSASNSQLAQAAKQVSNATAALVEAAKQVNEEPEVEFDTTNLSNAQIISKEMDQQIQILKLKKELEQAEKKLFSIRKKEYSDQTGNPSPAKDSDNKPTTSISVGITPTKRTTQVSPPSPPLTPTQQQAAGTPTLPPRPLMKKPAPSQAPSSPVAPVSAPVSKPSPKPAPKPAAPTAAAPNKIYTLEELKKKPANIDHSNLEIYLSDEEFKAVFNCERSELAAMPTWKRNNIKTKLGLF